MSRSRTLLSIMGAKPALITETIYALAIAPEPWVPHRVRIVTTAHGAKEAREKLIGDNHFGRLIYDLGLTIDALRDEHIWVIQRRGRELDDIRTLDDNEAAQQLILTKIRELTDPEDTELHVSLAGGRKTMSFSAGYALSLLGREQDRLSHVLVAEGYERPDFFYPENRENRTPAGEPIVSLADVPFVRLARTMSLRHLAEKLRFDQLCQIINERGHLAADLFQQTLTFCGALKVGVRNAAPKHFNMRPITMALYLYYVDRAASAQTWVSDDQVVRDVERLRYFYDCLRDKDGADPADADDSTGEKSRRPGWADEVTAKKVANERSRIRQVLKDIFLDGDLYRSFTVQGAKAKNGGPQAYGVRLRPEQIEFTQ